MEWNGGEMMLYWHVGRTGTDQPDDRQHTTQEEVYPHVYTSASTSGMQSYGGRLALPVGTIRNENDVSGPPSSLAKDKVANAMHHRSRKKSSYLQLSLSLRKVRTGSSQ